MSLDVSVIIPAHNESETIGRVIRGIQAWARKTEIIVVSNGSTDDTAEQARKLGVHVIEIDDRLGQDVPRAIGMDAAKGDVLVVVDADFVCSPQDLEPFVEAVERGVDVALNRYPQLLTTAAKHPTAIAKRALNCFLDRHDLAAASLTAVPHAVSRRALRHLGAEAFAVPPVAQAKACLDSLKVEAVTYVDVGKRNPAHRRSQYASVERLILGDVLEAVAVLCQERGKRGGWTDLHRRRDAYQPRNVKSHPLVKMAAVVPACNEEKRIGMVLRRLGEAGLQRRVVVSNGSTDKTVMVAKAQGAMVERVAAKLGHDVARSVGGRIARARRTLFVDGDINVPAATLRAFIRAARGTDVALNDIDTILRDRKHTDSVTVVKQFLNLALDRPDLGSASMTAVPHAIHQRALRRIGYEALSVPPLAQAKAVLTGCKVKAVHPVDVVSTNRFRKSLHGKKAGRPLAAMILGDHVEAIDYLQQQLGPRGPYSDTVRDRDFLHRWLRRKDDGE